MELYQQEFVRIRDKYGLTNVKISEQGVSESTLSRFCNGKQDMSLGQIIKALRAFPKEGAQEYLCSVFGTDQSVFETDQVDTKNQSQNAKISRIIELVESLKEEPALQKLY